MSGPRQTGMAQALHIYSGSISKDLDKTTCLPPSAVRCSTEHGQTSLKGRLIKHIGARLGRPGWYTGHRPWNVAKVSLCEVHCMHGSVSSRLASVGEADRKTGRQDAVYLVQDNWDQFSEA